MNPTRLLSACLVVLFLIASAAGAEAQWRQVPYDPDNFYGFDSMVWTVDEADQVAFSYVVNDRTMTVALQVEQTSVSGTPSQYLGVRIPGGYRTGSRTVNTAWVRRDGGSPAMQPVWAITNPNQDTIWLMRNDNNTFPNHQTSTNATYVYFTITFDLCAQTPGECEP